MFRYHSSGQSQALLGDRCGCDQVAIEHIVIAVLPGQTVVGISSQVGDPNLVIAIIAEEIADHREVRKQLEGADIGRKIPAPSLTVKHIVVNGNAVPGNVSVRTVLITHIIIEEQAFKAQANHDDAGSV